MTDNNNLDWWDDSLSSEGKNAEEIEYQKSAMRIKSKIELNWSDDIILKIKSASIEYPKEYARWKEATQPFNDKKGLDELISQHRLFSKKVKFKLKRFNEEITSSSFGIHHLGWQLHFEGVIPEFEYLGGEKLDSIFNDWGLSKPKYTPISWKFTSRVMKLMVQINPTDSSRSGIELYLDDYTFFNCYYEIVDIDKQLAQRFFELAKEMYPNFRPTMESFYAHPSQSRDKRQNYIGKTVLISNDE